MECLWGFGPMFGRAGHLARERMDARLSACEVTPAQAHVLLYLYHHSGQAPQYEVTRFMRVKPPTANGIVDRMEEKGLVRRSISGTDARRRLLELTEKGAQQQNRLKEVFEETEEVMLRGLSRQERGQLRFLLERVLQNLEEDRNL